MRSHSQLPESIRKKNNNKNESFEDLKKLIDEGYERFWAAPHRRGLRPDKFNFGYIDFSNPREITEDEFPDDLT